MVRAIHYEQQLRELHAVGYTDSEIAKEIGRSHVAIGIHRRRLGLPSNRFHQRYRSRAREYANRRRDIHGQPGSVLHWRNTQRSFAIRNGWPEDLCPREVTIMNALLERGPMNRMQICEAVGLRWRGGTRSLRCTPGGTYMACLMRRGLVVSLGKVGNFNVYSLGLEIEPIPVAERMPT